MADPKAKRSSRGEYGTIKYGASSLQADHKEMQDAHTADLQINGSDGTSLFGVFDGHGGDKLALYCPKQLHIELVKDPDYHNDLPTALRNVFFRIGENLRAVCVAVIRDHQITVANAGDSRCVLSRNGQAIDLSKDHKPNNQGERERIEAAGGQVISPPNQMGVHRVDGKIAISRALGDLEYNQDERFIPSKQNLTCNPEIVTENITDETDFLLIASDAFWHTKSSAHAVEFVNSYLQSGETDLSLICEKLVESCMASGHYLTVILVQFKKKPLDIIDNMWYEILLRLPAKMILRCRSVCKPWGNISIEPQFLQRHHNLQEPQLLLVPVHRPRNRRSLLHSVMAINLQCPTDRFRPIIRCTTLGKYKSHANEAEDKGVVSAVHASLDGMVLVSFDKTCYIINPATRRSSRLPPLDNADMVLGLYKHASSREYRVIYLREQEDPDEEHDECICILRLGSQHARRIQIPPGVYGKLVFQMDGQPPAVVGDRIYWPPGELLRDITVFDSEAEEFDWMQLPVKVKSDSKSILLTLDGFLGLSVSTRGESRVEVFRREDPQTWVPYLSMDLPVAGLSSFWAQRFDSFFISVNGDAIVECVTSDGDSEQESPGLLFYCGQNGEWKKLFEGYWRASPVHLLKESLMPNSFLTDNDDPALYEEL